VENQFDVFTDILFSIFVMLEKFINIIIINNN